ncbi:MAG: cadherin repeat domain-containing protein [Planctomycetota bacterium]
MERRQQYLLGGLVTLVVLWFGSGWLWSAVFEPIQAKREALDKLTKTVGEKEDQLLNLARSKKLLKDWQARSLPPDLTKTRQKPDALNAQRLYLEWLTDLAQLSGFEDLKVTPDRRTPKGNVYVSVVVKIEADARFEQLCNFLDRFYRTDLLHRVTSLRVQSKESDGDPFFQVTLDAEGLALLDAPQRRTLFSQTRLAEALPEDGTILKVDGLDGFPKEPGFRIRLKNEYLTVTGIDGTSWTVERGVDRTTAADYPETTTVERTPLNASVSSRTAEEFQQLLEGNIFVKPAPPKDYRLKLGPLGEKTYTRGSRPFEFTISAMSYDTTKGKPEFSLVGTPLPGLQLDRATGKLTWKPDEKQKADKYPVKFEVKHPSASGGRLNESVTIVLRDPNTPPIFVEKAPPPVILGREWKFAPKVSDAESPLGKLTWKLGDDPPAGLAIDEATGELTWTPEDSVPVGEAIAKITATDDGMPPQSSTLELTLDVQDDVAMFTRLTGIFAKDGDRRAILYDRSQNKTTELREGDSFEVADVKGTVTTIATKYLIFTSGDDAQRLELGQSLREATPEKVELPDATKPANVEGK